jgi:hypothetical protein
LACSQRVQLDALAQKELSQYATLAAFQRAATISAIVSSVSRCGSHSGQLDLVIVIIGLPFIASKLLHMSYMSCPDRR